MTSISTISVPSIWGKGVGIYLNIELSEEKKVKEQDVKNCIAQGYKLFNTHTTVVNSIMYVTYILTKE